MSSYLAYRKCQVTLSLYHGGASRVAFFCVYYMHVCVLGGDVVCLGGCFWAG